jgi:hypothetical protein
MLPRAAGTPKLIARRVGVTGWRERGWRRAVASNAGVARNSPRSDTLGPVLRGIAALVAAAVGLALPASASVAPRIVQSVRGNLDGDSHLEQAQVLDSLKPNPYGGTKPLHEEFARILDASGGRPFDQQISPVVERVRVTIVPAGIEDASGLTYPRAVWYAGGIGIGGAAPAFFGLVGWTGGGAKILWRYEPKLSNLGRSYDGAGAELFNDAVRGGMGPEVRLQEGIHHSGDPSCCPRTTQVSLYRFAARVGHYVLYSRTVRVS